MSSFDVGQRVYTVAWQDGQPCVESGKVILSGAKKPQKRVRCGKYMDYCRHFQATIEAAIDNEAEHCLNRCNGFFGKRPYRPWTCLRQLAALKRLYVKLKKHHLVGNHP